MKTATPVKDVSENFRGRAHLFRLNEPMPTFGGETTEFVVVSAIDASFSGPETYIFAADATGAVTSWGELGGSFRGAKDIPQALANAGYAIVEG